MIRPIRIRGNTYGSTATMFIYYLHNNFFKWIILIFGLIKPLVKMFEHIISYTAFAYRNLRAPKRVKRGQSVRVTVDVTNTGIVAGCEVVQLYVADVKAVVLRPVKELKAFAKVHLAPGQRKTVELFLDERSFSFYDPRVRRDWVAEDGAFELLVGSSSRDIRARRAVELVA